MRLQSKVLLFLITFSLGQVTAQSTRELFLEDLGQDNEVTIEMETNDPTDPNYRHMVIGMNPTDDGFVKMLSDNELSFFTNGSKRMRISRTGNVAIGSSAALAKLHVQNGRIALGTFSTGIFPNTTTQTGLDFYAGSNYAGGIYYENKLGFPIDPAPAVVVENAFAGFLSFRVSGQDRVVINSQGEVRIPSLASNSTRRVKVSANGTLNVETGTQFHNISPTMMTASVRFPSEHGPNIVRGQSPRLDMFSPIDLPDGAVITRVRIFYIDRSTSSNIRVRLVRSSNGSTSSSAQSTLFTSSGTPSSNTDDIETVSINNLNWAIGPSGSEKSHIFIDLDSTLLGVSSIILDYQL